MDLKTIAIKDSATLTLMHPTDHTLLDATIEVAGMDSETFQDAKRKAANKRMERMQRGGGTKYKVTAEEVEEDNIDLLAEATLGWEGIIVNGETLEFSKDRARELYREYRWIREQVDEFVGDRTNFFEN